MFLCIGKNRRSLKMNYSKCPGIISSAGVVIPRWIPAPGSGTSPQTWQLYQLGAWQERKAGSKELIPPRICVCRINRWPDKWCDSISESHLLFYQVCFCLSRNIGKFSALPYFFIRLMNNLGGCKTDTPACSEDFFDFLSCLKICWWWHILRLESHRISGWTSLSVSENLRCVSAEF